MFTLLKSLTIVVILATCITDTLSAPPAVNEIPKSLDLDVNRSSNTSSGLSKTLSTPSNRTETRNETNRMMLGTPPTSREVPNNDISRSDRVLIAAAVIGTFFPLAGAIGIAVHFCTK